MKPPATASLAGRRILIVEDDYLLAEEMARDFAGRGAEVLGPVPDLDRAFALLDARAEIHAALLDIDLQGQKVFPLASELKRRDIPFVFTTGYDRAAIPADYRDVPHLEKPLDAARVVRTLFGS